MISGNPRIYIGLYYEAGGNDGEFGIVWDGIGIRLMAYSDAWETLRKMPELMAKIDREKSKPAVPEFVELLKRIGFRDLTKRENPYTRQTI